MQVRPQKKRAATRPGLAGHPSQEPPLPFLGLSIIRPQHSNTVQLWNVIYAAAAPASLPSGWPATKEPPRKGKGISK